MLCNRYAYTCMILESLISQPSNGSFAIFVVHLIMVYRSSLLPIEISSHILMQIGLDAMLLDDQLLDIVCFLGTTSCLGHLIDNTPYLGPVSRLSTVELLMLLLKQLGFEIFFVSYTTFHIVPHLFIVTILVWYICHLILFNINGPSTLKLIFTLFETKLPPGKFAFFMPSSSQYAEIFTKSLPSTLFLDFRSNLNVHGSITDHTAGGC